VWGGLGATAMWAFRSCRYSVCVCCVCVFIPAFVCLCVLVYACACMRRYKIMPHHSKCVSSLITQSVSHHSSFEVCVITHHAKCVSSLIIQSVCHHSSFKVCVITHHAKCVSSLIIQRVCHHSSRKVCFITHHAKFVSSLIIQRVCLWKSTPPYILLKYIFIFVCLFEGYLSSPSLQDKGCHIWMSHGTYEWVMSHRTRQRLYVSAFSTYILAQIVYIYEWVMAHMNESWHIWMSHVT